MGGVDVVIPCYNYGHFLRESVESVLRQPGVDVRVLVIDDCSSDDSPQVGARLAAEDPRVEFRRHAVNRGHIDTYNEGLLDWARSEYSLLLSADDVLAPGALQRAVTLLDARPEAGMAYGRAICTLDPSSEPRFSTGGAGTTVISGTEFIRLSCELAMNIVPTPTAVVRTAVQKEVGGYRREFPHTGDMEMWLRFAARGPVGVVDDVQAYYRLHQGNMSITYRGVQVDLRAKQDVFDRLLSTLEPADHRGAFKSLAYQGLARAACRRASAMLNEGDRGTNVRECLKLAEAFHPPIRWQRPYMVVRAKMLAGATVSRWATAASNRYRSAARQPAPGAATGTDWLRSAWMPSAKSAASPVR
jgi:hypothetical protein